MKTSQSFRTAAALLQGCWEAGIDVRLEGDGALRISWPPDATRASRDQVQELVGQYKPELLTILIAADVFEAKSISRGYDPLTPNKFAGK